MKIWSQNNTSVQTVPIELVNFPKQWKENAIPLTANYLSVACDQKYNWQRT